MIRFSELLVNVTGSNVFLNQYLIDIQDVVGAINNHLGKNYNITDIPGVIINDQTNPFCIEWFTKLFWLRFSDYCSVNPLDSENKDSLDYQALFIWRLLTYFGLKYQYYDGIYKITEQLKNPQIIENIKTTTLKSTEQSETLPDTAPFTDPDDISPETRAAKGEEITVTDTIDKIDRLNNILRNSPDFWQSFLNEFNHFFSKINLDR